MTKENFIRARNASYEAMLTAQAMMEGAVNPIQKNVAEAIYEAHNALYWILCDNGMIEILTRGRANNG